MFSIEVLNKEHNLFGKLMLLPHCSATIGGKLTASFCLPELENLGLEFVLTRGAGRSFNCIPTQGPQDSFAALMYGHFDDRADLTFADTPVEITALDQDLALKEGETPDRAGVRVLRQACSLKSPKFPAIVVLGVTPTVLSFAAEQMVYIGRSSHNNIWLDSPDISSHHCRIGYESGKFWVEDLGSTNGTFLAQQQISGRQEIGAGSQVVLGKSTVVVGVTSAVELEQALKTKQGSKPNIKVKKSYPILISCSEVVKPARLEMTPGSGVVIGRDPSSDVWLGAPHISRRHAYIELTKTGIVHVEDESTNGISSSGGFIPKAEGLNLKDTPEVLNFGADITLAICFSEEQEKLFIGSHGNLNTFTNISAGQGDGRGKNAVSKATSREKIASSMAVDGDRPAMSAGAKLVLILFFISFLVVISIFAYLLYSYVQ